MVLKAEALRNLKDFILLRETSDNIIAHGFFDNNQEIAPDSGTTMKTTGTINIYKRIKQISIV